MFPGRAARQHTRGVHQQTQRRRGQEYSVGVWGEQGVNGEGFSDPTNPLLLSCSSLSCTTPSPTKPPPLPAFTRPCRSQFFRLADIFLASGMVPAYTAAAFAKRMARLALTAPPAGGRGVEEGQLCLGRMVSETISGINSNRPNKAAPVKVHRG